MFPTSWTVSFQSLNLSIGTLVVAHTSSELWFNHNSVRQCWLIYHYLSVSCSHSSIVNWFPLFLFVSFVFYFFQVETAGKMLVFMATQDMVDYHHDLFNSVINSVVKKKILFSKLHGNMTQQERFKIFNDFRQSTSGVLMCTVSSHYFLPFKNHQ